jgi:hypothetical protein
MIGVAVIAMLTAFKKGDTAYSKKVDTPLLAEPKPLAAASAKVGFAEKLEVDEVRGSWLHVSAKNAAGWIFQGNVSESKPTAAPSAGITTVSADSTDTVAAARPLTEAAEGYSGRHGDGNAKTDVEWVDALSAMATEELVVAYMRENEKGEYQK